MRTIECKWKSEQLHFPQLITEATSLPPGYRHQCCPSTPAVLNNGFSELCHSVSLKYEDYPREGESSTRNSSVPKYPSIAAQMSWLNKTYTSQKATSSIVRRTVGTDVALELDWMYLNSTTHVFPFHHLLSVWSGASYLTSPRPSSLVYEIDITFYKSHIIFSL